MKNLLSVLLIVIFISCNKPTDIVSENQYSTTLSKGGNNFTVNPLPPQISVTYPIAEYVTTPCPGYIWPQVCCDTVNYKFSVIAGRRWDGTPSKLTKYRIVVDSKIVQETSITGQSFSLNYIANLPIPSMNVFDTTTKKWHSLGLTVWQADGNLASHGIYIYK